MSDTVATDTRHDVAADVDEILEHVINGNMLSMPYDVYVELFDAVAELGVEIENLQSENAKLRELVRDFASYRHFDCQHCGYEEQCKTQQTNCYKVFVDLFNRTRKLGIEVDAC